VRITKQRQGPVKATLRRRENQPFVEAPVTVKRRHDGSIHLVVEASSGAAAALRVDNLPKPAGPAFSAWARQQLWMTDEAKAVVRLSVVHGEVEMWIYSGAHLGGINMSRMSIPKPMREWAARSLGLDIREA
jgi:streptogramin lyase